eukprot:gene38689-50828_t
MDSMYVDASTVSLVEDLQGSCQSVVDILNDLLVYESLSGKDMGSMEMMTRTVRGPSFLIHKINALTIQARQKGVSLEVINVDEMVDDHDTAGAMIDIDEAKFGQVIRNIVSNAIECTPSGAMVSISVEVIRETPLQTQSQSEYNLRISVHDNGPEILELLEDAWSQFTAPLKVKMNQITHGKPMDVVEDGVDVEGSYFTSRIALEM